MPSLRLFFHAALGRLCYWGAMSELVVTDAHLNAPGKTRSDRWLGIMASCAIVWYLLGFFGFVFTFRMSAETAQTLYTPDQLAYLRGTPFSVSIASVVLLGTGLIGSVYFLLRRKSAYVWYMVSLFAILLTMLDAGLRGGFKVMGSAHWGISIMVIILGIYLFWVAYDARNNNQIS